MIAARRHLASAAGATRAFLDNNVWNALVDRSGLLTADRLVAAFRSGRIEVVATIELFEEMLGTARRKPRKYDEMRRLARKLCGRRVLIPFRERNIAEISTGGALPAPDRYLPRQLINRVVALDSDDDVVRVINDDVYQRKLESGQHDRDEVDGILRAIEALGASVHDFAHVITADMVRDATIEALAFGAAHGFPTVPDKADVRCERVPSLWLYCAASMVSATRAAGAGRAVRDSDNHDRLHCSAGAYFDAFVTEDRELQTRLDLIPELPFEVMSPDTFSARLSAT